MTDDTLPYERERRMLGMLSAGRQWDPESFGVRGYRRLEKTDVAAAVGMIHGPDVGGVRLIRALLLYRWAGDESQHNAIVCSLAARLRHLAEREGWKIRVRDWSDRLASMALQELQGREVCRECSATGRVWVPGSMENRAEEDGTTRRVWVPGRNTICACCMGLGVYPWSLRERALFLGVHHSTWIQVWERRYQRLIEMVEGLERRGLRKLNLILR